MLKAIHAQEDKEAALDKLEDVIGKLKEMKLFEAARKVDETGIETLVYMDFPREHWRRIRSNNAMERLNREIRRRTRTVGIPRRSVCVDVSVCQVEALCKTHSGDRKRT